jgi:protein-tyrosine phosphatase
MNFIFRYLKKRHPFEYSQITDQLYVAAWPTGEDYNALKDLGVRLVINMDWVPADEKLDEPPLSVLPLTEIDTPLTPMSMENIWKCVNRAQEVFDEGDRVMVYCKGGVHRSGVMACCILISQGYTAEEAMALVKERRPAADPYTDHFKKRILKFEEEWNTQNGG